jgi:uncharacterized protein YqeY
MTIQERMMEHLKAAMKGGQKEAVEMLRTIQAGLKNKRIELQRELEEAEVIAELKRQTKQLNDSLGDFLKAERNDLVEKTKTELALIGQFLPTPMERAQIRDHVVALAKTIGAQGVKDMGKLMGAVMKAVGAAANGEDVKAEVEAYLQNEGSRKE